MPTLVGGPRKDVGKLHFVYQYYMEWDERLKSFKKSIPADFCLKASKALLSPHF